MLLSSASEYGSKCFRQPISDYIWRSKYQYKRGGIVIDSSVLDTWNRVSRTIAGHEVKRDKERFRTSLLEAFSRYELLPAGRILAGCGTDRKVSLVNTIVMPEMDDSLSDIMDVAKVAALTMKMGGGIGIDFSTLRPKGTNVEGLDCPASGPLQAMSIFNAICELLVSGNGRGAMMASMRCDHPDIIDFVRAKSGPSLFKNFNMSVVIFDSFMEAVKKDLSWALVWNNIVVERVSARNLWQLIMKQNYDTAEPGVLFIDRINEKNPLNYLEVIKTTNSCAEQPMPPNGTCPLASINLAQLVANPFSDASYLNLDRLRNLAGLAVRMLDFVIDESSFATDQQRIEALSKRRIGIGVTGVADALVMLNLRYGSDRACFVLNTWMRIIQNSAYMESSLLARDRGSFPSYRPDVHSQHGSIANLDPNVQLSIRDNGLRNGTLTTIAPTGTTSILAGNVSSGIEPIFALAYSRTIKIDLRGTNTFEVADYALSVYRDMFGGDIVLSSNFVTVADLCPDDHIKMQASAQQWVDSSISKTVNCPADISFDKFQDIYYSAYNLGCKGCTTYRPNPKVGSVLAA